MPSHTTITIFWAISVALVTLVKINSIIEDEHYFKKAALDQVRIVVLFEFIVNFYGLSLWLELAIVPVIAILAGMLGVAESDTKYKPVKTLLEGLFAIMGAVLISWSLYQAVTHLDNFGDQHHIEGLSITPIIVSCFSPLSLHNGSFCDI